MKREEPCSPCTHPWVFQSVRSNSGAFYIPPGPVLTATLKCRERLHLLVFQWLVMTISCRETKSYLEFWSHRTSPCGNPRNQSLVSTPWPNLPSQRASPHLGWGVETNWTRILTGDLRVFPSYQSIQSTWNICCWFKKSRMFYMGKSLFFLKSRDMMTAYI